MTNLAVGDRLDILEIIARYNLAADERDVEATRALYVSDGRIDGDFKAGPGKAFETELRQIFDKEGTLKRHVSVNHIFDGHGDAITVRSMLIVFEAERAPAVGATAVIRDEFRRTDDGWRIERHTVAIDPSLRKRAI